jgi:hypothetical protein
VVLYLLKIREEIKKLASGHISHRTALRLEKMPLFANFQKKTVENGLPDVRRPGPCRKSGPCFTRAETWL